MCVTVGLVFVVMCVTVGLVFVVSKTMRAVYCSIFLGNDPDWNQGLVHPLRVPHFRQHDKLACDHMPLHVVNKPRNHLIVSFQTAKGFKLLLRVKAGLKNQITE